MKKVSLVVGKSLSGIKERILVIAANPFDTFALNHLYKELDDISTVIRDGKYTQRFEQPTFINKTTFQSLLGELTRIKPSILHIAGHGHPDGGIILEKDDRTDVIPLNIFHQLIKSITPSCVLLNICYSNKAVKALEKDVKSLIGWEGELPDMVARQFAYSFYQTLSNSEQNDFKLAYEIAKIAALKEAGDTAIHVDFKEF